MTVTPNHVFNMQEQRTATICGHSFIARLKHFSAKNDGFDQEFGLSAMNVTWIGISGMTIKDVETNLPIIEEGRPHILYLHVAGNDLDSKHKSVHQVVEETLAVVDKLHKLGVRLVILSMVLTRTNTRHLSADIFNDRVQEYNATMKDLLVVEGAGRKTQGHYTRPDVWWWEHQKLINNPPLKDGVHLTDFPGQKRLYRSIRLALIEAEKHLSCTSFNS